MKEMSPSLPSMIGEIPPINSQETESLRSYAIPAPPAHLPEACQGWIQIAARRQQFFDSLRDEKPFLLGSDSCCAICYTLQEAFSTIWPNDRSRVPLKVTLSESDHQFVELSRFVVARYRFLVPHGKLPCDPHSNYVCRIITIYVQERFRPGATYSLLWYQKPRMFATKSTA